jgi:hypothetical protein
MGIQQVERLHCEICESSRDWRPYKSLPRPWLWVSYRIGSIGAIAQFPDQQKLVCSLACAQILAVDVAQTYCGRSQSCTNPCTNCGVNPETVLYLNQPCERCGTVPDLPETPPEDDIHAAYKAKIAILEEKLRVSKSKEVPPSMQNRIFGPNGMYPLDQD